MTGMVGVLSPAAHRLLVAGPDLEDKHFRRTVVYLLEHNEQGSVGIVLNRPYNHPTVTRTVAELLPMWQAAVNDPAVIFGGGPVEQSATRCLARITDAAAGVDGPDAELGLDLPRFMPLGNHLAWVDLLAGPERYLGYAVNFRIFAGCAGWGPGQLTDEIAAGGWLVLESAPEDIFSAEPDTLWSGVLRRQPVPLAWLSTYPPNVMLN